MPFANLGAELRTGWRLPTVDDDALATACSSIATFVNASRSFRDRWHLPG
jgi:hypothetical protein